MREGGREEERREEGVKEERGRSNKYRLHTEV